MNASLQLPYSLHDQLESLTALLQQLRQQVCELRCVPFHPSGSGGARLPKTDVLPEVGRFTNLQNAGNQQLAVVDQLGRRTSLVYNASGQVIGKETRLGQTTTFSDTTNGNIRTEFSPLGYRTRYLYDTVGRNAAVVNPLGERTSFAYTSYCTLKRQQNELGNVTSHTYDLLNRQLSAVNPLGQRTSWAYDDGGGRSSSPIRWGTARRPSMIRATRSRPRSVPWGNRPLSQYPNQLKLFEA